MWQVFDNDKPADSSAFHVLQNKLWKNSRYETLEEAVAYANNWLGVYAINPFNESKFNIPAQYLNYLHGYKYNGFDTLQIKEI